MGIVFKLAELLLMLMPVVAVIIAGFNVWKRVQRPSDRSDGPRLDDAPSGKSTNPAAMWRMITRTIDEHSRTDTRWMEYELASDKLLDFPMMTDMRDPLTTEFHKAKLRADLLRPARAEDLLDDRESAARYLAAVEDYVTAFEAAEAEAIRKRRSDFSLEEQQRITRARSLLNVASDTSATLNERGRAYELACKELDGLVVLPSVTREGIERGIAGQLDG